jgi:hypothetical protein
LGLFGVLAKGELGFKLLPDENCPVPVADIHGSHALVEQEFFTGVGEIFLIGGAAAECGKQDEDEGQLELFQNNSVQVLYWIAGFCAALTKQGTQCTMISSINKGGTCGTLRGWCINLKFNANLVRG